MNSDSDKLSRALEATVRRCSFAVERQAHRHGLTGADVEEIFQEVRIRLWNSLKSGEKIWAVPTSYVYRTASSAAVDLIRRRRARREEELDTGHGTTPHLLSTRPRPDESLEDNETIEAVYQAVDNLIASRRPVVRMHLLGYKLNEIAGVLGWSSSKTRNLLYRGLEDLRAALKRLGIATEDAT